MPAFLVTGNPGSGKSALAGELVRRGLAAIDPDHDPELAYWEDAAGRRVSGPPRPDRDWLGSHRWVWSRSRLQEILARGAQAVFVCGIARNQDELRDLFDRVFLLRIDELTQEARLAAHDALHPPGRSEAGRQEIRQGRPVFEAQMLKADAIPLDGTAPTAVIASELLALTIGTGDRALSACSSLHRQIADSVATDGPADGLCAPRRASSSGPRRRSPAPSSQLRTAVAGRLSRHHQNMSQPDGDEWRALRERRQPTGEEWAAEKARFTGGTVTAGVVLSHHPFGFFVDLGSPITGLVEIPRVKEPGQPVDPRDYPPVGQEITAVVLGAVDLQR